MKNISYFGAVSVALLFAFCGCSREDVSSVKSYPTHSVSFIASAPDTKTSVEIDGSSAVFEWSKADESGFHLYENAVEATEVIGVLDEDGKMAVMAEFAGEYAPQTEPSTRAISIAESRRYKMPLPFLMTRIQMSLLQSLFLRKISVTAICSSSANPPLPNLLSRALKRENLSALW